MQPNEPEKLRLMGNEIFKTCSDDLPESIFKERVFKCIKFYDNSKNISLNKDDFLKSSKNITLSYLKLVKRWKNNIKNDVYFEEFYYYSKECFKNLELWLKFSKTEGRSNILEKGKGIFDDVKEVIYDYRGIEFEEKMKRLIKLEEIITWEHPEFNSFISAAISRLFFNKGVLVFEGGNYIYSNSLFHNSLEFLLKAL